MMKLGADGLSIAAGPFTDGGDILGAMILRAATAEQAKQIEAEDPAVKAGMFTMDVLPFVSTDEGQFQPWATPFARAGLRPPYASDFATATEAGLSTSSPMR